MIAALTNQRNRIARTISHTHHKLTRTQHALFLATRTHSGKYEYVSNLFDGIRRVGMWRIDGMDIWIWTYLHEAGGSFLQPSPSGREKYTQMNEMEGKRSI